MQQFSTNMLWHIGVPWKVHKCVAGVWFDLSPLICLFLFFCWVSAGLAGDGRETDNLVQQTVAPEAEPQNSDKLPRSDIRGEDCREEHRFQCAVGRKMLGISTLLWCGSSCKGFLENNYRSFKLKFSYFNINWFSGFFYLKSYYVDLCSKRT